MPSSTPLLSPRPKSAASEFENSKLCSCFADPASCLMMTFNGCFLNLPGAYMFGTIIQHARGLRDFHAESAAVWWATLKAALFCAAFSGGITAGVVEGVAAAITANGGGAAALWGLAAWPMAGVGYIGFGIWSMATTIHARRLLRLKLELPRNDGYDALVGFCCQSCVMCQDYRVAMALAEENPIDGMVARPEILTAANATVATAVATVPIAHAVAVPVDSGASSVYGGVAKAVGAPSSVDMVE